MTLSAGKLWGMRRLADSAGFWKMVAIDQRTPLFGPIAKARGVAEAPYEDVARMKALLARHLAPKGSALLVDPNYGYSAAVPETPARCGLMLSLEHHVTEETPGGRKSRDIPDWSVAKIRQIGGDAVKLLIWHRADSAPEVRAHQLAYAEAVGRACKAHDIVYLLEVLVYPLPGEDPVVSPELRAERVLAPNWESVGDYSGRNKTRAEFVAQMGGFAAVLPDMRWEVVEILRQGDRYVVRGRARATPVRPFFGVEPSGKGFDIMSIDIHTVANGRIVRSYHVEDWASALRQLRAQ